MARPILIDSSIEIKGLIKNPVLSFPPNGKSVFVGEMVGWSHARQATSWLVGPGLPPRVGPCLSKVPDSFSQPKLANPKFNPPIFCSVDFPRFLFFCFVFVWLYYRGSFFHMSRRQHSEVTGMLP